MVSFSTKAQFSCFSQSKISGLRPPVLCLKASASTNTDLFSIDSHSKDGSEDLRWMSTCRLSAAKKSRQREKQIDAQSLRFFRAIRIWSLSSKFLRQLSNNTLSIECTSLARDCFTTLLSATLRWLSGFEDLIERLCDMIKDRTKNCLAVAITECYFQWTKILGGNFCINTYTIKSKCLVTKSLVD